MGASGGTEPAAVSPTNWAPVRVPLLCSTAELACGAGVNLRARPLLPAADSLPVAPCCTAAVPQNRRAVLVCNLKPANMRGIKSCAMVLAATSPDGKTVSSCLFPVH